MKFTINFLTPDNGEKFIVELSNATLTNIKGFQADNPDLTLSINRSDLTLVMMGIKSMDEMIDSGVAKAEGNVEVLNKLKSAMTQFEMEFEILPGTASKMVEKKKNPFQQDKPGDTSGG